MSLESQKTHPSSQEQDHPSLPFDVLCEVVLYFRGDNSTLRSLALVNSIISHQAHKLLWASCSFFITYDQDPRLGLLETLRRRREFVRKITITSFVDLDAVTIFNQHTIPTLLELDALQSLRINFLFPENPTTLEPPPLARILHSLGKHTFPSSIKSLIIMIPISNPKTFDAFEVFWTVWCKRLTAVDLSIIKDISSPISLGSSVKRKDFPFLTDAAVNHWSEMSLIGQAPLQRLVIRQTSFPFASPTTEEILKNVIRFKDTLLVLELYQGFPGGPSTLPIIVREMPALQRLYLALQPINIPSHMIDPDVYASAVLESAKAQTALRELYITASTRALESLQPLEYFRASKNLEIFGYGVDNGLDVVQPILYRRLVDRGGETSFAPVFCSDIYPQVRKILPSDPEIPPWGKYPPFSLCVGAQIEKM